MIRVLETIGASRKSVWAEGKPRLYFPCRGHTHDGRTLERCLVQFNQGPPMPGPAGGTLMIRDLAAIEPSHEALPPAVRQVATMEWECGRGYAPTPVVTPDGERFVLNWVVNFFAAHGWLGRDLALADELFDVPANRVVTEDAERLTVAKGDWDAALMGLCPPQPPGLPKWMHLAWGSS